MKTILVPVDFSAVSERQISTALLLAGPDTKRIHYLHVEPPVAQRGRSLRIRYQGQHLSLTTEEQEDVVDGMVCETLSRTDRQDLEVTSQMRRGVPRECIMAEKEEIQAGLIILGSHGHHALYNYLTGCTSLGILEEAEVPLVILPQEAESGLPPQSLSTILVPCDFSDSTDKLLAMADYLAGQHEGTIHLLHVSPDPNMPISLPPDAEVMTLPPDINWDDLKQHLSDLKEGMSCPQERVEIHVEAGPRASLILKYQDKLQAELICMGTHPHSALYDLLVGSITESVLFHSPVPVLAVPASQPRNS